MVKLLELHIHNVRGIRDLRLKIDGRSASVFGPNGSGKSSVVDAIDFLLTGKIHRLTGEGTAAVSLSKHGPHLAAKPASAIVKGVFGCDDSSEPVTIVRCIDDPETLEIEGGASLPSSLEAYLDAAATAGLHLLTRRQVLDFILADPSTRNARVAALLRTDELDSTRKELQGAEKLASDGVLRATGAVQLSRQNLLSGLAPPAGTPDEVLTRVNEHRALLGAQSIVTLDVGGILTDIVPLTTTAADPLQSQRIRVAFDAADRWVSTELSTWLAGVGAYRTEIHALWQNEEGVRALRSLELIEAGLRLASRDECPLCLTVWRHDDLAALLRRRASEGRDAAELRRRLDNQRGSLLHVAGVATSHLRALSEGLQEAYPTWSAVIADHASAVHKLVSLALPVPTDDRPAADDLTTHQELCGDMAAVSEVLRRARERMDGLAGLSGVQKAWDELSGVVRHLKEQGAALASERTATATVKQLSIANTAFIVARDAILQNVYDHIATGFASHYAAIHRHDDDQFAASLAPTKAGLKLEVAFHDKGSFPPAAVHSEGHQDSMGLCLFLALVEHLSNGMTGPIILDDVVMSVDREHRRGVAELLVDHFRDSQFIITTHDRVWWYQLRTVGLVASRNQYSFRFWTLTDGPECDQQSSSPVAEARAALSQGDVPAAAHRLRRMAELFGPEICNSLGASLRYRADGGWTAGEFLDAGIGRYRSLLKKAKAAANSWNQDFSQLSAMDTALTQANKTLGGERWAVNVAIHFNEWAELSPQEFAPVLDAHDALMSQLYCADCEAMLYVVYDGSEESVLRCTCGKTSVNLVSKA